MKAFDPLPRELDQLSKHAVDAAIKVHSTLGPGLLESVYETCLAHELRKRGLTVESQVVNSNRLRRDSFGRRSETGLAGPKAINC